VTIELVDRRFASASAFRDFASVCAAHADADRIAVDIPIGCGPRDADQEARAFVGPRWASVFPTPPEEIVRVDDYAEAVQQHPSLSRQSFALFRKIQEVAECVDARVIEVHPEVSFRALKGAYLEEPKSTWNGFMERRALLAAAGIEIPDALPAGLPLADVLDAAVAGWSAARHAQDEARRLGSGPSIWY
jgi:predicted RNase H-like nuclease